MRAEAACRGTGVPTPCVASNAAKPTAKPCPRRRPQVAATAPSVRKAQSSGGSHQRFDGHCSHSRYARIGAATQPNHGTPTRQREAQIGAAPIRKCPGWSIACLPTSLSILLVVHPMAPAPRLACGISPGTSARSARSPSGLLSGSRSEVTLPISVAWFGLTKVLAKPAINAIIMIEISIQKIF